MVATYRELTEEVEIYKYFEFDNLDSLFIQNEATKTLIEASNRVKASKTPNISNGYFSIYLTNSELAFE